MFILSKLLHRCWDLALGLGSPWAYAYLEFFIFEFPNFIIFTYWDLDFFLYYLGLVLVWSFMPIACYSIEFSFLSFIPCNFLFLLIKFAYFAVLFKKNVKSLYGIQIICSSTKCTTCSWIAYQPSSKAPLCLDPYSLLFYKLEDLAFKCRWINLIVVIICNLKVFEGSLFGLIYIYGI